MTESAPTAPAESLAAPTVQAPAEKRRLPKAHRFVVVDLETILDVELPAPGKKADGTDEFPAPPWHQIAACGLLLFREDLLGGEKRCYRVERLGVLDPDECKALQQFVKFVTEYKPTIVGWNTRGFDMPVIAARCLRHAVAFPYYYQSRDMRYRFTTDGHFDLADYLGDHGAARPAKLDGTAKLIGMPGKIDGCDGSKVGEMIANGHLDEVQAYVLSDVVQPGGIFLRVQYLRGLLDGDGYVASMADLIEWIDRDPRLKPVSERLDRTRLLTVP